MRACASFLIMALLRILLVSFIFMGMAKYSSADILQNPDFETPPTNMTAANTSSTTAFLLTSGANTVPGWSYNGTVWYISSSPNYSLPGDGHGIKLGENGKINQTFRPNNDVLYYVVSFTLAAENENCYNNSTAVNVSVPRMSKVFSLESKCFSRKMWESHAFYLEPWGGIEDSINLEIKSVKIDAQPKNITCWPVVDTIVMQRYGPPIGYSGNMLVNSDLEIGPAFVKNSSEGILLADEPDLLESPLQQWSILGTVKYIDSKHYSVPKGKAAIELISGAPSGILGRATLTEGSKYTLEFLMGDANDSCAADFIVYAQVGTLIQNFTMRSSGKGSHQNFSMTFEAKTALNPTSIASFNESRTSDNVLCGPVIDNVVLRPSPGVKMQLRYGVPVFSLIFNLVMILWLGI